MRVLSVLLACLLVAPALGADRSKAEKALKEAVASENSEGVKTACDDLLEVGGKESLNVILGLTGRSETSLYWQLVNAAGGFKDQPALEELGKYIVGHQSDQKSSLARDLLFALQNNHSSFVTTPLAIVLEKGSFDLKLLAIDQLAVNRSIEAVDALIAATRREEKADDELKRRIENALKLLTGESFGDAANWEGWWKKQRASGIPAPKAAEGGGSAGGTMEKPRDNEWHGTIEKLGQERIVVLAGCYDEIQPILEQNKIPHTVAKKTDFDNDPQRFLKEAYALLINCDDCYEGKPPGAPNSGGHRLSDKTLQAVKQWVEQQGGYLFCEDWGLIDVTGILWPDKISTLNGAAVPPMTDELTVKLTPARGMTTHPLMRGVWQKPRAVDQGKREEGDNTREKKESPAEPLKHKWKVDNLSAAIKIVDPQSVMPLLESEELGKAHNGSAVVAATFRTGTWNPTGPKKQATGPGASPKTAEFSSLAKGGRVLQTVSHFGHQSSEDDGQALHNLLINFMLEAAKHHAAVH
jgi:hypothetical protein